MFWYFAKYQYFRTKRAEIHYKVNALNAVRNSVGKNLDNIINLNAAGVEDGTLTLLLELKTLYAKRAELSTIYTPQSEPIKKEINRLINEA